MHRCTHVMQNTFLSAVSPSFAGLQVAAKRQEMQGGRTLVSIKPSRDLKD